MLRRVTELSRGIPALPQALPEPEGRSTHEGRGSCMTSIPAAVYSIDTLHVQAIRCGLPHTKG